MMSYLSSLRQALSENSEQNVISKVGQQVSLLFFIITSKVIKTETIIIQLNQDVFSCGKAATKKMHT
jgi:hypothetical protein